MQYVVLGHPEYYPRFGFEPASVHGLASQWEGVPDATFMVSILDVTAMTEVYPVRARYRDEFREVGVGDIPRRSVRSAGLAFGGTSERHHDDVLLSLVRAQPDRAPRPESVDTPSSDT